MTALTLLILIALLWAVKELILGTILRVQRSRIRHGLRVEVTQRHFAEARNQLMELALREEIDVNSATFAVLYNFNTALMRRPDEYPALSAHLRRSLFSGEHTSPLKDILDEESKHLAPSVKDVMRKTSSALKYIIINHSLLLRSLYRCRWFLSPTLSFVADKLLWLYKLIESHQRKDPVFADVRAVQEEFNRLAAAA